MASAWLNIAVDWEDSRGWYIPELLDHLMLALTERSLLSVHNNNDILLIDTALVVADRVITKELLEDMHGRINTSLFASQNLDDYSLTDFEPWTQADMLAFRGLPSDLFDDGFDRVFDYRWISYWFYVLQETNTTRLRSMIPLGGAFKFGDDESTLALAQASFLAEPYFSSSSDPWFGRYGYSTNLSSNSFHRLFQTSARFVDIVARDKTDTPFQIPFTVHTQLINRDLSVTLTHADGSIFDVSSQISWTGTIYRGNNVKLPDIYSLTSIVLPDGQNGVSLWDTNSSYHIGLDLNDSLLIDYTPIA